MPTHGLPAHWLGAQLATGWMREGACLSRTDLPWTADGHQIDALERLTMAAVCESCPVLARCADFATRARMTGGFWAGAPRDESTTTLATRVDVAPASSDVGGAA